MEVNKPEIVSLPIREIKPWPKNPRNGHAVDEIARSIEEFGYAAPILVQKKTNRIVAGHGRLEALKKLGATTVPVVVLDLDDDKADLYTIADNKLTEKAEWDFGAMADLLTEFDSKGLDTTLTGFSDEELKSVAEWPSEDAIGESADVESHQDEAGCYKEFAMELIEQIDAMGTLPPFQGITPAYAKWRFIRALHHGEDYPRHCSHAFQIHQIRTSGDSHSLLDGLRRVAKGEIRPEALQLLLNNEMVARRLSSIAMPMSGARQPLDFPAALALDLIDEFSPRGGVVLDPSHGWGGRMVGFLLSRRAARYVAIDPSEESGRGVDRIFDALCPIATKYRGAKSYERHAVPFEDFSTDEKFDMALTSPPYFDTESYTGGIQSSVRFKNFNSWNLGFFSVLIRNVFSFLKPGGVFALQVGSQSYPLVEQGKLHAREHGFKIEDDRTAGMPHHMHGTAEDRGERILILRKP